MLVELQKEAERFESRFRALRKCRHLYFQLSPALANWHLADAFTGALDAIVQSVGFNALGSGFHGWRQLGEHDARELLVEILWRDLAYRTELMSEPTARELANTFLAFFSPGATYFSNRAADGSWNSLTDATFDAGVIALDRELCGIICVADQD